MKTLSNLDEALRLAEKRYGLNILRVASAVKDGETVTFGTTVFEVDVNNPAGITAGRVRVDLSGSATAAAAARTGTLSANLANGDTITVGTQTYTARTALSTGPTVANEIFIGADLTATRNNLVAAINGAAGAGTLYSTGTTANASCSAAANSTNALDVTARTKGTAGNSIALAEVGSNFSWASAATTLAGGVDPTAAEFTTALAALAVENVVFTRTSANEVLVQDRSPLGATRSLACSATLSGSNNAWAAAATYGFAGERATPRKRAMWKTVPNATEVALGSIYAALTFVPSIVRVSVVVTSTGAVKAWGGTRTVNGNVVKLTNNTTNDFATTDTVTVEAIE